MRRFGVVIGAIALGLVGIGAYVVLRPQPEVVFRFNPGKTSGTCTFKRTTAYQSVISGKSKIINSQTYRIVINPVANGFTITRTPESGRMTMNGRPATGEDGEWQIMAENTATVYNIDKGGHLRSVKGSIKTRRSVQGTHKSSHWLDSFISRRLPAMSARVTAQWNTGLGELIGRPTSAGTSWRGKAFVEMPPMNEPCRVDTVGRVTECLQCEGHDCVRIKYEYTPDEKELIVAANGAITRAVRGHSAPMPMTAKRLKLTGEREVIIDPATMITYLEKTDVRIDVVLYFAAYGDSAYSVRRQTEERFDPDK